MYVRPISNGCFRQVAPEIDIYVCRIDIEVDRTPWLSGVRQMAASGRISPFAVRAAATINEWSNVVNRRAVGQL